MNTDIVEDRPRLKDGAYACCDRNTAHQWVLFLVQDGVRKYLPRLVWEHEVKEWFCALGYTSFTDFTAREKPLVKSTLAGYKGEPVTE